MNSLRALFSKHPLVILVSAFIVAYIAVFAMFNSEGRPKTIVTGVDDKAVHIDVHMLNIDFQRDIAAFTFAPDLKAGNVAAGGRLNADIAVEVDTGSATLTHVFKKGDAPSPWTASVPIEYGDPLDYPFDKHGGDILVKVKREGTAGTLANVDLDKVAHGFVASARADPTEDKSQMQLRYEVGRSPAVIFLALMAMTSLTLVVLSAVNVAKQVAMHGRKVEFGMLVWIAALLFVIPAVRNGLPGSPPAGALVDIALFFWLHILGVGALLTVVSKWKTQT